MAKVNEHGRIIAAAAKAVLEPLGPRRKGQSRLWYSDQRFWIISVEFQPSSWSKGTYLNMGVRWLWRVGGGLSISYRPVDFIPFESVEQFMPPLQRMAERAAQETTILKDRFRTFSHIYEYLLTHATRDGWPIYDAAIAAGLKGDQEIARRFFDQLEAWPTYGYDWELALKESSAALAALLSDPAKFRSKVLAAIERNRAFRKMPPDPNCLETADFQPGQ